MLRPRIGAAEKLVHVRPAGIAHVEPADRFLHNARLGLPFVHAVLKRVGVRLFAVDGDHLDVTERRQFALNDQHAQPPLQQRRIKPAASRVGENLLFLLRVVKQHHVHLLAFAQRILRAMQVSFMERHEFSAVKPDFVHPILSLFRLFRLLY